MAHIIRNSIVINRPLEEVFSFVVDPATTPQWQSNLVVSELVTPGSLREGSQIREVRQLGKSQREAIWEVTSYEPFKKRGYVYPTGFGPIRQRGESTFKAVEGGTLIEFTAWIEGRFPFNLLLPLLANIMRKQNDKSYAVLKRVLEQRQAAIIR